VLREQRSRAVEDALHAPGVQAQQPDPSRRGQTDGVAAERGHRDAAVCGGRRGSPPRLPGCCSPLNAPKSCQHWPPWPAEVSLLMRVTSACDLGYARYFDPFNGFLGKLLGAAGQRPHGGRHLARSYPRDAQIARRQGKSLATPGFTRRTSFCASRDHLRVAQPTSCQGRRRTQSATEW
jgi:hypothetical protein